MSIVIKNGHLIERHGPADLPLTESKPALPRTYGRGGEKDRAVRLPRLRERAEVAVAEMRAADGRATAAAPAARVKRDDIYGRRFERERRGLPVVGIAARPRHLNGAGAAGGFAVQPFPRAAGEGPAGRPLLPRFERRVRHFDGLRQRRRNRNNARGKQKHRDTCPSHPHQSILRNDECPLGLHSGHCNSHGGRFPQRARRAADARDNAGASRRPCPAQPGLLACAARNGYHGIKPWQGDTRCLLRSSP